MDLLNSGNIVAQQPIPSSRLSSFHNQRMDQRIIILKYLTFMKRHQFLNTPARSQSTSDSMYGQQSVIASERELQVSVKTSWTRFSSLMTYSEIPLQLGDVLLLGHLLVIPFASPFKGLRIFALCPYTPSQRESCSLAIH